MLRLRIISVLKYSKQRHITEVQTECTVAFPQHNGYANAPQCYVERTMPLWLITAYKNNIMIDGSIHLYSSTVALLTAALSIRVSLSGL
jgi:hypothetical protein